MKQFEKPMSEAISALKTVAEMYSTATGTKLTALSSRILNNSGRFNFVFQEGGDLGTRQQEKSMRWFSDNWPGDLSWPADIERPPVSVETASEPAAE